MRKCFIAVVCLSLAFMIGGCEETSSQSSVKDVSSTIVSEDIQKLSADDFVNLFASDASGAEERNKGKVFEITGTYEGDLLETTIQISSTKGYDNYDTCELRFSISKDEFNSIGDISKGDTISLKATFNKVTAYTLEFEDTTFISFNKGSDTTNESEINEEIKQPEEHNTSEYIDYLALKAKQDAITASDNLFQEAEQWILSNVDSIFNDNDSMEKAMYYGELLEYKHKDTGNQHEKLGWQTFKTVKYVYRSIESKEDEEAKNNYNELKEIVNSISTSSDEVKGEIPTELVTENVAQEQANPIAEQAVTDRSQQKVYIADSGSGKKYHSVSDCSEMEGTIELTLEEAESQGYTPCKKCF